VTLNDFYEAAGKIVLFIAAVALAAWLGRTAWLAIRNRKRR
jgi:hypothetical protein